LDNHSLSLVSSREKGFLKKVDNLAYNSKQYLKCFSSGNHGILILSRNTVYVFFFVAQNIKTSAVEIFFFFNEYFSQAPVAHICNPSYFGG
jgi:hypothetical protein